MLEAMSRRMFVKLALVSTPVAIGGLSLTGCVTDPGYFVGTWEFRNTDEDGDYYTATLTVNSDNTWSFYQRFESKDTGAILGSDTESGIWKISGDTLLLLQDENSSTAYHCKLNEERTVLFFPMADGTKMELKKQPTA